MKEKEPKPDLSALSDLGANNPFIEKPKLKKDLLVEVDMEATEKWFAGEGKTDKLNLGS